MVLRHFLGRRGSGARRGCFFLELDRIGGETGIELPLHLGASDDQLGTGKWSAGPTVVVLKQQHGWTYGVLANHLWSFGGDDDRADVNTSFVQPFLSFTTARFTTFGVNTETSYDWESDQATVPVNLSASQLFKVGGQPMSLALAYRHYFDAPPGGPDWGLSLTYTLLFPK